MDKIAIREAREHDAKSLLEVHYDAVHNIASSDYSDEIVNQWSLPIDDKRIGDFLKNPDNEIRLVAEVEDKIVGFGALVIEKNELRACYVSSKTARKGIGNALVEEIEKIAQEKGLTYLQLDSSLTAEQFYKSCGYKVIERGNHTMRNGMVMASVKMRKDLIHNF